MRLGGFMGGAQQQHHSVNHTQSEQALYMLLN